MSFIWNNNIVSFIMHPQLYKGFVDLIQLPDISCNGKQELDTGTCNLGLKNFP